MKGRLKASLPFNIFKEKKQMKIMTAVAYARFSSDKQQESSIAVQLSAIRRFCASHNIQLIHEYVDEAQTGTNSNRKSFQQIVKYTNN